MIYSIQHNDTEDKWVVCKNGQPIKLPTSSGCYVIAEFDNRQDAEVYVANIYSIISESKYSQMKVW